MKNHWTPEADAQLKLLKASGMGWSEIAAALGHPWTACRQRFYELRWKARHQVDDQALPAPPNRKPCIGAPCVALPKSKRKLIDRRTGFFMCDTCRAAATRIM